MSSKCLKTVAATAVFYAAMQSANACGAPTVLHSFESAAELTSASLSGVQTALITGSGISDGTHALSVNFSTSAWATLRLPSPTSDWSAYGWVAVDVTNPNPDPCTFTMFVTGQTVNGSAPGMSAKATIPGNTSGTFAMSIAPGLSPSQYGMVALPPPEPGDHVISGFPSGSFQVGSVASYGVFTASLPAAKSLVFDRFRTIPLQDSTDLTGIVDSYGQYKMGQWAGKLSSAGDLSAKLAAENADLAANTPTSTDDYGGWLQGPQMTATGYFYTVKYSGHWWLVTPQGHLFFSVGMDGVRSVEGSIVTGREPLFAAAPPLQSQSIYYTGPAVSAYYVANLQAKYGSDYYSSWVAMTTARLQSWGFNTIGNWSDSAFFSQGKLPYTVPISTAGTYNSIPMGMVAGAKLPDPYDPAFNTVLNTQVSNAASSTAADPKCIGYFVDNELVWGDTSVNRYAIARSVLAQYASSSPAKVAFINYLKSKYTTIAALNSAWVTQYTDWTSLNYYVGLPGTLSASLQTDLQTFIYNFAVKYFSTVNTAIKTNAPNHLYLGCRFGASWITPEVMKAAGEQCDVVSLNIYQTTLSGPAMTSLGSLDKPCLISEFHIGSNERGMFSAGMIGSFNAADRAKTVAGYMQSVAADKRFIGCHWYKYVDDPTVGRGLDGANHGIGFVDVTDTPYTELVSATRSVSGNLAAAHAAAP